MGEHGALDLQAVVASRGLGRPVATVPGGAWLLLSTGGLWQRVALQRGSACPPGTKGTSVQPGGGRSRGQPLQPVAPAEAGQPASALA